MRPTTIQIFGSKPTILDVSCRVVYSKYTTYDVSHMQLYATCPCFSHRNGRVAGVYRKCLFNDVYVLNSAPSAVRFAL